MDRTVGDPYNNALAGTDEALGDGGWDQVVRILDATDQAALTQRIVERVRVEAPEYAALTSDDIFESTSRNAAFLINVIRQRRIPTPEEVQVATRTAGMRARQGISVEAVLLGYEIGLQEFWASFKGHPRWPVVSSEEQLQLAEIMWQMSGALMRGIAASHQAAEVQLMRQNHERRSNLVRALLRGELSPMEIQKGSGMLGIAADKEIVVFRARPVEWTLAETEKHLLGDLGLTPPLCIIEGDLAGLLPSRPNLPDAGASVGIANAPGVAGAPAAFARACRALDVALASSKRGCFDLNEIGFTAAVRADPDLADLFIERYLRPLDGLGDFRPLLIETLRSFIQNNSHVADTAKALFVHQNTIRHRLGRFEELTGADIGEFTTIIELWWALEAERMKEERS